MSQLVWYRYFVLFLGSVFFSCITFNVKAQPSVAYKKTNELFSQIQYSTQANPSYTEILKRSFIIFPIKNSHINTLDTVQIITLLKEASAIKDIYKDSAIKLYKYILQKSEYIYYRIGIAKGFLGLVGLYERVSNYDSILAECRDAIIICSTDDRVKRLLPWFYNSMGSAYMRQGKYEQSIQSYYKSAVLCEQYSSNLIASVYINLSSVLLIVGKCNQALYYLHKAEIEGRKNNYPDIIILTLMNKGLINKSSSDYNKAISTFNKALVIAEKNNLLNRKYLLLINIGITYYIQHKYKNSLAYFLKADQVNTTVSPYDSVGNLIYKGSCYYQLKQYSLAMQTYRKAITIARNYKLPEAENELQWSMAVVYSNVGKYKSAFETLLSYISKKDSLQGEKTNKDINNLEVKFRTAEKDKELNRKQMFIAKQDANLKKQRLYTASISLITILIITLFISIYRINKYKQNAQNRQITLLQQEQELKNLKAMIAGEEKERTRLARELHDGVGGMLTAIKMNLGKTQKRYEHVPEMNEINEAIFMLQDTANELRKAAHNLMPDILVRHNLQEALEIYCNNISEGSGLEIDLQFRGNIQFEKNNELLLYRIIQELIQNIVKHANATYAAVQLRAYNNTLTLTVEDNGCGFDVNNVKSGYGIQNLIYRVKALNGDINIESSKNGETTVYMEFNLETLNNNKI